MNKLFLGHLIEKPVLIALSVVMMSALCSAEVVIARKGKALAQIVIAADAGRTERYAADELSFFLRFVTGGIFSISSAAPPSGNRLLVGAGAAKLVDPGFSTAELEAEEIVVRSVGPDLILAGGSPRGTLYAVYSFLEDVVGCRWWSQAAWRMPHKSTLIIPDVSIRYAPPLEYREPFWYVAFDPDWAARNKVNGIRAGGDDLRGGRHIYEGFVHTLYSLIPPERYFEKHPEWFSEINGQRTHQDAQLCLTNEEMRQELVKNLKERLRANRYATIASVSQNDCRNNCTCPCCRAVDEEEGSPAGSLLRFVNAVAADIETEFPGIAIDTLAYQYTRKPPRLVRPRPNVIVRLCSIECSFSRPLDDPVNQAFLEDLEGWSKIADRLFIWDYTTNFAHYVQPHPNTHVLGPNIRLFIQNNVRGVFEQGAYQSWGAEMAELRAWILAKILWNPGLDAARLKEEFVRGYYGSAAVPVSDYLSLMERAVLRGSDHLGCYSPPDAKFLSLDTLLEGWRILQKAEKKASPNAFLSARIRRIQMTVAYVVLVRWESLRNEALERKLDWPWPAARENLLAWFLDAAKSEGVTMISEWQKLEDWAAKGGKTR